MSIYTEHAKRFLENCGIRITGKYKGMFTPLWDKEQHSTWEIVLHRGTTRTTKTKTKTIERIRQ